MRKRISARVPTCRCPYVRLHPSGPSLERETESVGWATRLLNFFRLRRGRIQHGASRRHHNRSNARRLRCWKPCHHTASTNSARDRHENLFPVTPGPGVVLFTATVAGSTPAKLEVIFCLSLLIAFAPCAGIFGPIPLNNSCVEVSVAWL